MPSRSSTTVVAPRLKVLVLSPGLPYPPIWGFGIRVYHFLRLLARCHDVTLLTYEEPDEAEKVAAVRALGVTVHTVPRAKATEASKRRAQFGSMFSPESYQRRSVYASAMQSRLTEISRQNRYDIIQVESSQLAGFDFGPGAVVVLDEHNIEYELLHRMYQTERSIVRRLYNWLEFIKFRREEVTSWGQVAGCVMTSTREQRIVAELVPGATTIVGANAVDVEHFAPVPGARSAASTSLVMTGLMHYRPNIDGAVFFVNEIMPRLLAVRPELIFYIVGAGATDEVKDLAGPNVVVTGTVPDVRPYVRDAAVFVVPLRMGGGTRLKVLEGMAMGKPVVSTAVGCEGIDVVPDQHLLVADEPQAFASGVLALLENCDRAARLGAAGRALVERRYRWESVVSQLEDFYHRLLQEKNRVGGPSSVAAAGGRRPTPA